MIRSLSFNKTPKRLATSADVIEFEQRSGIKLSKAFVEFCQRYNGGYPSPENEWYPVPPKFAEFHAEYHVGKGGIIADGLYGLTDEMPGLRMSDAMSALSCLKKRLLPISFDLLGDYVVLIVDQMDENVYWFDHEMWEGPSRPMLFPIADGLEMFYNGLTRSPYASDD